MTGADLKALKVMEEYAKETIIRVAGDVDKELQGIMVTDSPLPWRAMLLKQTLRRVQFW